MVTNGRTDGRTDETHEFIGPLRQSRVVQTVRTYSSDIGMEFGISKCAVLTLKKGKIVESNGIALPNGEVDEKLERRRKL